MKYGTIENYFSEALGIDSAAQKALRDLYLVHRIGGVQTVIMKDGKTTRTRSEKTEPHTKRRENHEY